MSLIKTVLQNAYDTQNPGERLIFHSDLSSQYTSDEFACLIEKYIMKHPFSYKGSPSYDNTCIESFHAIFKKEKVNHVQYLDENSARIALFQYLLNKRQ